MYFLLFFLAQKWGSKNLRPNREERVARSACSHSRRMHNNMYVYIFFLTTGSLFAWNTNPFGVGGGYTCMSTSCRRCPPIPLQIMAEHRDEVRGVFCVKYCDLIKTQNFFTLSEVVGDHEGREMSTMTHSVF